MKKMTDTIANEIASEMSELGYECDPEVVKKVHEHAITVPLPNNAALTGNILAALDARGVKITP